MQDSVNNTDILNQEVWVTIAPSDIHGVGIFAIRDIPSGTIIWREPKESMLYIEMRHFNLILEPIRDIILDRTIFHEPRDYLLFRHPNDTIRAQCFMNHSLTPNSDGETAIRDIVCGEEITENFITLSSEKLHRVTLERMPFLEYKPH